MKNKFDIIVIGGGHAGIEASYVAANMGCDTALVSMSVKTMGKPSCNPSIGGTAKGHIVKEIDALGGEMGKAIDRTGIQFRILNTHKGPAVRSSRAQADREKYRLYIKEVLENQSNLDLKQGIVEKIIVKNGVVVDIRRQYDTIEVDVQCPPDTIRVYQEVEVPTYVPEKKEKNIGKGALLGFIFALVIVKITGAVLRK